MLPKAPFDKFILQNADGIIVVNHEGLIRLANPAAAVLFGRPADELVGYLFGFPVVSGETSELDIICRDGQHIIAEMRVVETEWAGEAVYLASIRDITGRKRLEEQLRQTQKMEAVGRLAGGIAHDFNNLLTIINGYADLLLGDSSQFHAAVRPEIQVIRGAGERAARLTRQLLAFSRRQVLNPEILNLNQVMADLEKALHHLLGEGILLEIRLAPGLGNVKVDRGQMEQVIFNLVINAHEAMPGGGKLTVETANTDLDETMVQAYVGVPPGSYVTLAFSDTGPGISAETLAYIFEPFFTTKEQGQGSGLGLAMVHGIISQSGGHIRVYSQAGQGATFKIFLPRLPQVDSSPRSDASLTGSETILVIESDPQLRQLIARSLSKYGYTVLEGANQAAALLIYQQHTGPIHLLLTEMMAPELTEASSGKALKVLYMPAYSDEVIAPLGLADPSLPFIEKPFTTSGLVQKIRETLDA